MRQDRSFFIHLVASGRGCPDTPAITEKPSSRVVNRSVQTRDISQAPCRGTTAAGRTLRPRTMEACMNKLMLAGATAAALLLTGATVDNASAARLGGGGGGFSG